MPSETGRLWHCVTEASSVHPPDSPYHHLSFSRPFLEQGGWSKVNRNVRRSYPTVPAPLRAGVFFNRPHGQWRNADGNWEITLDAWLRLRGIVDGDVVPNTPPIPTEARGLLGPISDVGNYAACAASIEDPLFIYLGWEPEEFQDIEDQACANNLLADMIAPELAAKAARGNRKTIVCIDGITSRRRSAWMLQRLVRFGLVPSIEGLCTPGSELDVAGTIAVGTWRQYTRTGGAEGVEDRVAKSAIFYEPENGATVESALELVRMGGDLIVPFQHPDVQQIAAALAA